MSTSLFDLTGKAALVTGGNSGIGLGMAEGLVQAGADVAIWGTNAEKNAAALERLQGLGGKGRVIAQRCDVADEAAVEREFAATVEQLGRVDACFANAGVGSGRSMPFAEMTTAEWRRVLDINLDGVFFTLRTAARHMLARGGGGSLVSTSSLSALMGAPRGEHYVSTKGAMIAMMRTLAVEFGRHGIRANTIIPGWIESDMTKAFMARKPVQEKVLTRVPLGRWGTREDFAGIAVYLASDASRYHSGDEFVIDGAYQRF